MVGVFQQSYANINVNLKAVSEKDINCLAKNVYFEANGENSKDWTAITLVVFNRIQHDSFPKTVCGVIAQRAQFSWLWDGKKNIIKDKKTYAKIKQHVSRLMRAYVRGNVKDFTRGAIFYNNPRISKSKKFFRRLTVTYRSEKHVYYKTKLA